jgi:hypothetical protein
MPLATNTAADYAPCWRWEATASGLHHSGELHKRMSRLEVYDYIRALLVPGVLYAVRLTSPRGLVSVAEVWR